MGIKDYINELIETVQENNVVYSANIKAEKGFSNPMSNTSNSKTVALIDSNGNFGFLKGDDSAKPYTPLGGLKILTQLYKDGLIEFKKYNWGDNAQIKRGRKIK